MPSHHHPGIRRSPGTGALVREQAAGQTGIRETVLDPGPQGRSGLPVAFVHHIEVVGAHPFVAAALGPALLDLADRHEAEAGHGIAGMIQHDVTLEQLEHALAHHGLLDQVSVHALPAGDLRLAHLVDDGARVFGNDRAGEQAG
jgi:hypothetical protein